MTKKALENTYLLILTISLTQKNIIFFKTQKSCELEIQVKIGSKRKYDLRSRDGLTYVWTSQKLCTVTFAQIVLQLFS